jgi:L-alanine-DL-glutamate epimerase-like enolase superfamily enzyme
MKRRLTTEVRSWPLKEPFVISRGVQTSCDVVVTSIAEGAHAGRGEAAGVDYHGETIASLCDQLESVRREVERGAGRRDLIDLLPPGGARNALDSALWDLEAKQAGVSAWELAGVGPARPVISCYTIGIRTVAEYEARARSVANYAWLKVKVSADRPLEAVAAVRRGAPQARLVVDANQAWSIAQLRELAPALAALGVDLLEQPIPIDDGAQLATLDLPVPICADEPANTIDDLPQLVGCYDFINIKLDKCGGLTTALDLAHAARDAGLRLMVGCMIGGSIAMAPAMVLAQLCEVADLDGPLLQAEDWPHGIVYRDGVMQPPSKSLWG